MNDGTPHGLAAAFDKAAQAHPDRLAFEFDGGAYSYKQLRDLAAAFAIKMNAANVDARTVVQAASIDPAIVLPAMLATAALGARFATPTLLNDAGNADPRCILTTTDEHIEGNASILKIDQSFSPAKFERAEKELIWDRVQASRPCLRILHNAKPVCINLEHYFCVQTSNTIDDKASDSIPKIAILHSPANWRYLVRASAVFVIGGILIDAVDTVTVLTARPDLVSGTCTSLKIFLELLEAEYQGVHLPRVEVSDQELWRADIAKLTARFETLFITFEHHDFGLLNRGAYVLSQFGTLEYEVCAPALSPLAIVDAHGTDVAGQIPGYVFAANSNGDVVPTGYVCGWGANNELRVLGFDGFGGAPKSAQDLYLALVDAVLRSVDGIEDAASFRSPKRDAGELLAFAVFRDEKNRAQASELARHYCQKYFGDSGTPSKIWTLNVIPKMPDGRPNRDQCSGLIKDALGKA